MGSDDRSWFDPLVRSLGNRALRFALMNVGDLETAQDVVQEAFIRCWSSPKTPSNEVEFLPWLYRVIVNLARDYALDGSRTDFLVQAFLAKPAIES